MEYPLAQVRVDPSFWIWLGVLVVVVLISGVVLIVIRRRLFSDHANADMHAGWILEQLRVMRSEGKITQEEFDETRRVLIAKVTRSDHEDESEPASQDENANKDDERDHDPES